MKNKNKLTEEDLNEIKKIQETKKETRDSILFGTELLTPKEKKNRDKKKEKEVYELASGEPITIASIKELNKMLFKRAAPYEGPIFMSSFYDVLRKLTGYKKSKKHPAHYNPSIFAVYTLRYVYRRFKIKNLIKELQSRNPFITGQTVRANKHFQYLKREDDILKLIGFIKDVIDVGGKCNDMTQFDEVYCRQFGLPTDGTLF